MDDPPIRKMSVGFTGTRRGMNTIQLHRVRSLLRDFRPVEAHHGDCIGADEQFAILFDELFPDAHMEAHPSNMESMTAYAPADVRHDPKPPLERNRDIVDACHVLIAAPDGPERTRSGTWSTVRYGCQQNRFIVIFPPHGQASVVQVRVDEAPFAVSPKGTDT